MSNDQHSKGNKQLVLRIPATILSNQELSFSDKLVLGLDYTYQSKKGYNILTNKGVGELLSLHPNIVSLCRKKLVEKGYLTKEKRDYKLTEKHRKVTVRDKREIVLPFEIYNHPKLTTGAKLLWGEYNSISRGCKEYFARRSYTSVRLNASRESVSNWTGELRQNELLKIYEHNRGFCSSQRVVITCGFKNGEKDLNNTRVKDPSGRWVIKLPGEEF